MGKHICILQTSFAKRDDTIEYLKSRMPDLRISFITDSVMLEDVRNAGAPTASVRERLMLYALAAEKMGADLILNTCSTVGDVADDIARIISAPLVRIDAPMARQAASLGDNIALISTVETTVAPSRNIIVREGRALGREINISAFVEQAAWEALSSGDTALHNRLLIERISDLDGKYDAVVMAQVSMRALLPELSGMKTPVLCSFYSGLDAALQMLGL